MKNFVIKSVMMMTCLLFGFQLTAVPLPTQPTDLAHGRWEKLGQRKINYRLDRDEIKVTAREGVFSAVQLKFKKGGVNLHRFVIYFRDGSKQEVMTKNHFKAGTSTRVVDLKGRKRVIRKVVLWYDTKNVAHRRGVVELWGRH